MNIKETIKLLEDKIRTAEATKTSLVNSHLNQINMVIEERIMELKNELREYGINKVCGEEYKVLEADIETNKKAIETLKTIESDNYLKELLEGVYAPVENKEIISELDGEETE